MIGNEEMYAAASPEPTTLSVVIETFNEKLGPVLNLEAVLEGLAAQTYPQDLVDITVVIDRDNGALRRKTAAERPDIAIVVTDNASYYDMKTIGMATAKGDVIVLLDSDCIPVAGWAESIIRAIESGAHVVAGKTRYPQHERYALTFNFFNFGYIRAKGDGTATGFLPNNVAFRREVILKHRFNPKIKRGGAAVLLGFQLQSLGFRIAYVPSAKVEHNMYGFDEEILMRVKSGFDSVNITRMDADKVSEESQYLQYGALALAPIFLRRVIFDMRMLLENRQDLGLTHRHIPYFLVVSPLIRALEMIAGLITIFRPTYFRDKYQW